MLPIFLYLFVSCALQVSPDVAMGGGLKQSDLPPLLLGRILAIFPGADFVDQYGDNYFVGRNVLV